MFISHSSPWNCRLISPLTLICAPDDWITLLPEECECWMTPRQLKSVAQLRFSGERPSSHKIQQSEGNVGPGWEMAQVPHACWSLSALGNARTDAEPSAPSLLEARELFFFVDKEQVSLEQSNGVRQGSPDTPVLFAAKTGEVLDATLAAVNGGSPPSHRLSPGPSAPPPPHSGAVFMDDPYWGESPDYVQQVLQELETMLINAKKTQVISNHLQH